MCFLEDFPGFGEIIWKTKVLYIFWVLGVRLGSEWPQMKYENLGAFGGVRNDRGNPKNFEKTCPSVILITRSRNL
jgi:hypothetical protein